VKVALLSGGTGGARLAMGLAAVLPPDDLSIVANTGDDEEFWARCTEQLSDEMLADLSLSCALWIGMGRVLRTLDIGQACKITA